MSTISKIITAIVSMKKLKVSYDEGDDIRQFVVLPHLLGKFKSTGNIVLSAWDDDDNCWKSFLINQILCVNITDEFFEHTSSGYNPKDKRMSEIVSCISTVR